MVLVLVLKEKVLVLVLKKYGGLGLGLDKKVLFTYYLFNISLGVIVR